MRQVWGICMLGALLWMCTWQKSPSWGVMIDGFPLSSKRLETIKSEVKIPLTSLGFYLQFSKNGDFQEDLDTTLKAIFLEGWRPLITLEPSNIAYQDIVEGKYDSYLREMAKGLKKWQKPIILRFAHEMNLSSYHWGAEMLDSKSPERYIAMWRYIVHFFRGERADNVQWLFCPNVDSVPSDTWNQAKNYYPGGDVVDLLGMDGYDFGNISKSFEEIFSPLYYALKKLDSTKPMVIGETATFLQGEERKAWIASMEKTCTRWGITTLYWFHVNKERNWAL